MTICGLKNSLLKTSTTPQAPIENLIKKYLYDAFQYHFDQKLSIDQKEAMLVSLLTFIIMFIWNFLIFLYRLQHILIHILIDE
jgi:hypothetical protein